MALFRGLRRIARLPDEDVEPLQLTVIFLDRFRLFKCVIFTTASMPFAKAHYPGWVKGYGLNGLKHHISHLSLGVRVMHCPAIC